MNYCLYGEHIMKLSKSKESMKCIRCDFQANKQTTWTNYDTGMEVDITRLNLETNEALTL